MNTEDDIRRALSSIGNPGVPSVLGRVTSIDATERTCDVADGDAIYYDVALQSIVGGGGGILVVPKIGSAVLMIRIEDSEMWSVVQCSEVDRIEINDGLNGGMVNVIELTRWMTTVKADLEALSAGMKGLGVPVVITTNLPGSDKIEDKKFTH